MDMHEEPARPFQKEGLWTQELHDKRRSRVGPLFGQTGEAG